MAGAEDRCSELRDRPKDKLGVLLLQKRCNLAVAQCTLCRFQAVQKVIHFGSAFRWAEPMVAHFKKTHLLICIDVAHPVRPNVPQNPPADDVMDLKDDETLPQEVVAMGFDAALIDQRRLQLYETLVLPSYQRWAIKFALILFQSGSFSSYMCILCKTFFREKPWAENHLLKAHCCFETSKYVPHENTTSDSDE